MRPHSIPNFVIFAFILILLFGSTVYFTNVGLDSAWVELNENQIMYLYSTSAQVVAAVYGLTLAGYIFFRGELNREAQEDQTLAESIGKLESRYFQQLAMITTLVMTTILLTNLIIAYENSENSSLLTFFMNLGQSVFAISFIAISFFIVDILLPGNIKAASKSLQDTIDPKHGGERKGDLTEFVKTYNSIENLLALALNRMEAVTDSDNPKTTKRMPNTRMAELLCRRGVITRELFTKLRNLITLRHAIMHGADPTVSQAMVDRSGAILMELRVSLAKLLG